MKHFAVLGLVLLPTMAFAQGVSETLVQIEDMLGLFTTLSLWSTIIIMFATSAMVFSLGRKMHGGVFGTVLTYFSIGMTLVVFGFVSGMPFVQSIPDFYLKIVHDSLYIIGYILMGIAASKLLNVIKGE